MKLTTILSTIAVVAATLTDSSNAVSVHPSVHRTLLEQGTVNIFVTLKQGTTPALNAVKEATFATRGEKIASIVDTLERHAATSQTEVASLLAKEASSQLYTKVQSYWITNQIYIKEATIELIDKLAAVSTISTITEEEVIPLSPMPAEPTLAVDNSTSVVWGVGRVNAPRVWQNGNTGQNTVVGIIDTGARWTHTIINKSYLNNGFSWFDPSGKSTTPYDDVGHGTHVTGTIAGDNGFGVAPGAKWMMCKGCNTDNCLTSDLLACFQFMACPTNPTGTVRDCSKSPRLVSNSWTGGPGVTTFWDAVEIWRVLDIVPVFANGNRGPWCSLVGAPADFDTTIGVGAIDVNDQVADFSSRGPSISDGILKPDISAPGVMVMSAWHTGDMAFNMISGTSMATPHVSGVISLMLSANPTLTYEQIKDILTAAVDRNIKSVPTCGGTPSNVWPNNQYGYGVIDAVLAELFAKAMG